MNLVNRLLIVDGASCAGKSTLCAALVRDHGFTEVGENARYAETERGGLVWDDFASAEGTPESELRNQALLFSAERARLRDARAALSRGERVVVDKSILSVLATAYAFGRTGRNGDLPHAMRELAALRDELAGWLPGVDARLVMLTAPRDVRAARNADRGHVLDGVWIDGEVTEAQDDFLRSFLMLHMPGFLELDTGKMRGEEVVDRVIEYYEG